MLVPWLKLASDATLLAMEAQTVIGLRLGQIAMGRGTLAENQLMVTEKMLALTEAATTIVTGGCCLIALARSSLGSDALHRRIGVVSAVGPCDRCMMRLEAGLAMCNARSSKLAAQPTTG
jgi:hypothetical protein